MWACGGVSLRHESITRATWQAAKLVVQETWTCTRMFSSKCHFGLFKCELTHKSWHIKMAEKGTTYLPEMDRKDTETTAEPGASYCCSVVALPSCRWSGHWCGAQLPHDAFCHWCICRTVLYIVILSCSQQRMFSMFPLLINIVEQKSYWSARQASHRKLKLDTTERLKIAAFSLHRNQFLFCCMTTPGKHWARFESWSDSGY